MSGFTYDPSNQTDSYTLYVNDTLFNPSSYSPPFSTWFFWNASVPSIKVTPNNNSEGGNHSIAIEISDGISAPVWQNFTIEVI